MAAWQVTREPELVPFEIEDAKYKKSIAAIAQLLYNYCCARQISKNQESFDVLSIGQKSLSDLITGKAFNV